MQVEHLSASRIGTFDQCQLQYHATYDLKLPELPPHPLTVVGKAVHKVLERAVNAMRDGSAVYVQGLVGPVCKEMGLAGENLGLVLEFVNTALLWGYLRNVANVHGCELEFRQPLPDGTIVTGFVDRLDVNPNGSVDIIDLKTGKKCLSQAGLQKDWQPRIYNYAVRNYLEVAGPVTASFWYLREQVQRVTLTAEDAACTELALTTKATEIRGCTTPTASPSRLCPWCRYRNECDAARETGFYRPR